MYCDVSTGKPGGGDQANKNIKPIYMLTQNLATVFDAFPHILGGFLHIVAISREKNTFFFLTSALRSSQEMGRNFSQIVSTGNIDRGVGLTRPLK